MEAGIELRGSEVKSLRNGKAQMTDAYAVVERRRGLAAQAPHPALRAGQPREPRARAARASCSCTGPRSSGWSARRRSKGLTLIPTRIYFKGPRAKVELALARGKEGRDRRREIAERDVRREVEREFKGRMR